MIDGSEKRNRQLTFELQNSHVCEKRSKWPSLSRRIVEIQKFCYRGNLTLLLFGKWVALLFREDSRERTRPDLTEQRKSGLSFAAFFLNKRPESKEGEICMFTHVARTPLVASHISSEANGRSLHASYSC